MSRSSGDVLGLVALALVVGTGSAVPAMAQSGSTAQNGGSSDGGSSNDAAVLAMRERNAKIQLANYPREALRRGEQGIVGISVATDRQGRLRECAVSQSSGSASLDAATCDFLFDHAKIQSYLAPGGGGPVTRQKGQVVWQLPAGFKPAVSSSIPAAAIGTALPLATKKICRAQATTGSLIASQRICLTRADWERQYAFAQDATKDMHTSFQRGE